MDNPNAKLPTATELENLIYEAALNRALIQLLITELEKTTPGFLENLQETLNAQPGMVYGLVSQFVEQPSPYYASLLAARDDARKSEATGEALIDLLKRADKKNSNGEAPEQS